MQKGSPLRHGFKGSKKASWECVKQRLAEGFETAVREGLVDEEALPFLRLVNARPEFMTSSSCYGRVMLIDLPGKKDQARFVFVSHSPPDEETMWAALEDCEGEVWFKFDPLILHVSCRDMDAACALLRVKGAAGLKRGGVFSVSPNRVQIEIEGTARMALPVKAGNQLLVSREYFDLLLDDARKKFAGNARAWDKFASEFGKAFRS
ncbi:MAG: hypothetical protein JW834_01840 [Candidatus Diapherotrites archaeon]|nr:hypothetical protein [Candidatus Diapherotrites archaeon]